MDESCKRIVLVGSLVGWSSGASSWPEAPSFVASLLWPLARCPPVEASLNCSSPNCEADFLRRARCETCAGLPWNSSFLKGSGFVFYRKQTLCRSLSLLERPPRSGATRALRGGRRDDGVSERRATYSRRRWDPHRRLLLLGLKFCVMGIFWGLQIRTPQKKQNSLSARRGIAEGVALARRSAANGGAVNRVGPFGHKGCDYGKV